MPTSGNIRILGFIKRRPDLTEEQFYEHWEKVHGPLVAPWAVKHGFVSYSQVCMPYDPAVYDSLCRRSISVGTMSQTAGLYDQKRSDIHHADPYEERAARPMVGYARSGQGCL
jgi:hypothetical protein